MHYSFWNLIADLKNTDNLSNHMKELYLNSYSHEYFQKCWISLYNTLNTIYNEHDGNLCRNLLSRIRCPTLIIHGNLDPMITPEHPHQLKQHISNSRYW
jgi:valacyclovir hydrolase